MHKNSVPLHNQPLSFSLEQQREIDRYLLRLADRVASPLVVLSDVSGQLILYRGRLPAAQCTGLSALAAASFAAGMEIGNFLGLRSENNFRDQLHEGKAANLYTLSVGPELLLIIAFTSQTTLGLVRLFAQQYQEALLRLVQEARQAPSQAPAGAKVEEGFGRAVSSQLDELFPDE